MTMLMGGAVRVDVDLAGMIMHAKVTFGQAMCDAGVGGESEGGGRGENAKRVERGSNNRRFRTRSFGQYRQHLASSVLNPAGKVHP